jgi:hypothetical protein
VLSKDSFIRVIDSSSFRILSMAKLNSMKSTIALEVVTHNEGNQIIPELQVLVFTQKEIVTYTYSLNDSKISFLKRSSKAFLKNALKVKSLPFPDLFYVMTASEMSVYSSSEDKVISQYFNSKIYLSLILRYRQRFNQ